MIEGAVDVSASQRLASDPMVSAWVDASAGSGKTKVLTDRVLRLLLTGARPGGILCITFTRAAAAEMAERVTGRLGLWATAQDADLAEDLAELTGIEADTAALAAARRLHAELLDAPEGLRILTIHSLCQSILKRFPIEAGLLPHFEVLEEREAAALAEQARRLLFEQEDDGTAELAASGMEAMGEKEFLEGLANLLANRRRLADWLSRIGGREAIAAAIAETLGLPLGSSPMAHLQAFTEETASRGPALRAAAQALATGTTTDRNRSLDISRFLDEQVGIDTYLNAFLTAAGIPRKTLANKSVATANPDLLPLLTEEALRCQGFVERRHAFDNAEQTALLVKLGEVWLRLYSDLKARQARLDYEDLIEQTEALLSRPGISDWVLYKLDGGLDHVLIDEAQDTSPAQWRIIDRLVDEFFAGAGETNRTLFVVGDAKQSIYSFQGADRRAFQERRRDFSERAAAAKKTWRTIPLTTSFRSTTAVLDAVDAAFNHTAAGQGVVEPGARLHHRAHRQNKPGMAVLWPMSLAEDRPDSDWTPPVEQHVRGKASTDIAKRIAEHIAETIASGDIFAATEKPATAGDFLILMRRRGEFQPALVRALKNREIPVTGADRMTLLKQLPALDLVCALEFALLPEDDLTLATVLKSPLVGWDDDLLCDVAAGRSGFLIRELTASDRQGPARAAGEYLSTLMSAADYTPPFEFLQSLLNQPCPADPFSGRRAMLARLGPDADDAIEELLSLALVYERQAPPSLQGFLDWLREGDAVVKRDVQQAARNQVRVMTVHGSKGLQAPVVILADAQSAPNAGQLDPILWAEDGGAPLIRASGGRSDPVTAARREAEMQAQQEEYHRLLYVGMTRAQDRLIVCGHGAKMPKAGTWYHAVGEGLDALSATRTDGDPANPERRLAYGRPLERSADRPAARTTSPGRFGLPLERGHPDWVRRPAPAEPSPGRPLSPSRPALADPGLLSPLAEERRFARGLWVHKLLEVLPDLPRSDWRTAAQRYFADRLEAGADPPERLVDEVLAILEGPAFASLFGPGSRAEVPLVGTVDGRVISGRIDRLVVTGRHLMIVDYKTNRPPPGEPADIPSAYLAQMGAYAALMKKMFPSHTLTCALLWTEIPDLMVIPDALLATAPP